MQYCNELHDAAYMHPYLDRCLRIWFLIRLAMAASFRGPEATRESPGGYGSGRDEGCGVVVVVELGPLPPLRVSAGWTLLLADFTGERATRVVAAVL